MAQWIINRRKKLGMSQSDLAEMMGISRPTLSKIEQGDKDVSAEEKERIARILQAPEQETNSTSVSGKDVEIRQIPRENTQKFREVLLYILTEIGSRPNIGQTALYKILYFIDFDYFEKYEEPLIGAEYIKNTHGPTPRTFPKVIKDMEKRGDLEEVESNYFGYGQQKYLPHRWADVSKLSGPELNHIEWELERLGNMSARELSDFSHSDTPWAVHSEREPISYETVFYRDDLHSVREYDDEL
jgi:transcriptional regulator with XRE-family HTH domain